uniref:Uncharacterized protein n=1 Tax=Ascaris lumbricoides TaxID=6252 RepID=A0A0M3HYF7_ASCLU
MSQEELPVTLEASPMSEHQSLTHAIICYDMWTIFRTHLCQVVRIHNATIIRSSQ